MPIVKKRPFVTTKSVLGDIPRPWLLYIEPKIVRPEGSTCWLWTGATDKDGEPVLTIAVDGKRKLRRVKRIVAELFWEFSRYVEIIHECGSLNCINPAHWYLSPAHWTQEDRGKRVAQKQHSIKQYVNRKKFD